MSCSMKYNCCQQSDLCPQNKICKPFNSPAMPWKRFTCECPDGYHGNNCDQPITSCQGYTQGSRKSGKYKIVDSADNSMYEVYCHFESDSAWTLVQSYSLANGSWNSIFKQFRTTLAENHPVGENALNWSGYRLSKPRMKSIKDNSTILQFTCEYEKNLAINKSDYVQILLQKINPDVFQFSKHTSRFSIDQGRGKIGGYDLTHCQITLYQDTDWPLHIIFFPNIQTDVDSACADDLFFRTNGAGFFGDSEGLSDRLKKIHRCATNDNSTTQLWFGKDNTAQARPVI